MLFYDVSAISSRLRAFGAIETVVVRAPPAYGGWLAVVVLVFPLAFAGA